MAPKVSVLMSVLNGADFLRPAVESILNQSLHDFEFVIIDNASRDATPDILDSYGDQRIVRVRNEQTLSLTQSLNKGLRAARGDYIARLDADDLAMPSRLSRQVSLLDSRPDVLLVGTQARMIDESGRVTGQVMPPTSEPDIYNALACSNPFLHSSVMFRRAAVLDLGGYPETYVYAQDLALWLKLAQRGRLAIIPEQLIEWREHRRQASQSRDLAITRCREMIDIFGAAQRLPGLSQEARQKGRFYLATLHCMLAGALLSSHQVSAGALALFRGVGLAPLYCLKRAVAGRWRVAFPAI